MKLNNILSTREMNAITGGAGDEPGTPPYPPPPSGLFEFKMLLPPFPGV